MSNLKAYLAEKYMSGPKADAILARTAPSKKKKRKVATPVSANSLANLQDEDGGWGGDDKDDADDVSEAVVASDRGFKKRKVDPKAEGSGWAVIREGTKEESPPPAEDEKPVVVEESKGFVGGLMTASQLQKAMGKKDATPIITAEEIAQAQETVYRDASGKKIDTKAARAEAARLKREREEKEAQKMEWGKGLVQREEKERERLQLEKQRGKTFARHADDTDLNEEQRAKELWNDPAAAFLTKSKAKGPRRPEYNGPPPPPNRFGIKPGYRWDGVDRGNGFEKKMFQSRNDKKRRGLESYQWGAEDIELALAMVSRRKDHPPINTTENERPRSAFVRHDSNGSACTIPTIVSLQFNNASSPRKGRSISQTARTVARSFVDNKFPFGLVLLATSCIPSSPRVYHPIEHAFIFPPDQSDFLVGQYFDVRLEVHAPVNGSEARASNVGVPDENFTFCIQYGSHCACKDAALFFGQKDPFYEDLFAQDAQAPTPVNVAAKAFRAVNLTTVSTTMPTILIHVLITDTSDFDHQPGTYYAKLRYYGDSTTVAKWVVREPAMRRRAKNVLFFIGDGMTQAMITAARLIAHKSVNGRYQTLMQMDQMDNLGHQMTHSLDSFITDSANSATALYTGKKGSVSALNVYADSVCIAIVSAIVETLSDQLGRQSPNSFDDPKIETIAQLFRRVIGGPIGMVSTAFIADATPAALCSATRDRNQYAQVVQEYLEGAMGVNSTFNWPPSCDGPDVVFGGGAEQFIAGSGSPGGKDYYQAFKNKGYNVVYSNTELQKVGNDKKVLGIFSKSNMAKWVDRHIFPENLKNQKNSPTGDGTDALDQPGLKEMTLKAIDVLQTRQKKGNTGWFMMSEAASIDKMMHVLDYDRALGELLELDDTIRASIEHLKKIGEYEDTLIVVTADHGHGFDIFGGADTKYLAAQTDDRHKRKAGMSMLGVYQNSGLSGYTVGDDSLPNNDTIVYGAQGPNFPVQWNPRYTFAAGFGANPDHRETYAINANGPRLPAVPGSSGYEVNPVDDPAGFIINGTLPTNEAQGVHSLTDVSVFANGPGSEAFRGFMSFEHTPIDRIRRLPHQKFIKPPSNGIRDPKPLPTTAAIYGQQPNLSNDADDEDASALSKFAKYKQQQTSRPGAPKTTTSPLKPDRWDVPDTSVNIAGAFNTAVNTVLSSTMNNPNQSWTSATSHPPTRVVGRGTSVEYEDAASRASNSSRRLQISKPGSSSRGRRPQPLSKSSSFPNGAVPDSEGEEELPRGKSPFRDIVSSVKSAYDTATFFARQKMLDPAPSSHDREPSYDYEAEEKEYADSNSARRAKATNKRNRMSEDNRAYRPQQSEDESDGDEESDDEKTKKRKKKKGPAVTMNNLPVIAPDKRRKKKPKDKRDAAGEDAEEDEASESDEASVNQISMQHRTSTRSDGRHPSLPRELTSNNVPPDTSMDIEQGLDSIPEVDEEFLVQAPQEQLRGRAKERQPSQRRSVSRQRSSRIGGPLGQFVNFIVRKTFVVILFVWKLITGLLYLAGGLTATVYDVTLRRPMSWIPAFNTLLKMLALGLMLSSLYILREPLLQYFPAPKLGGSRPVYHAPEIPAANIAELAARLQVIETALAGLSLEAEKGRLRAESDGRAQIDLVGRLGVLETKVGADSRKAAEVEMRVQEVTRQSVGAVRQELEVLQAQVKAAQQHAPPIIKMPEVITDDEARARVKALEERVGGVEGGIKEALELAKKPAPVVSSDPGAGAAWWNKPAAGSKSGMTIKSTDGQDVTSLIEHLVDSAVSTHGKDVIARPDYALHSGGASVIPSLTSPTHQIKPHTISGALFGYITGNGYAVGRPPVWALHHDIHPGHCWAISGHSGQLGVSLAAPIYIDAVTIDHVAAEVAFDMSSAPREMELWGLVEGQDNLDKVTKWKEEKQRRQEEARENGEEVEEEPKIPSTFPRAPLYVRIAKFAYDIHAPKNVQTFEVDPELRAYGVDFGVVVLTMNSNWGQEYTCLYRLRVHGKRIDGSPSAISDQQEEEV
ncbi:hypothetical protein H0H93_005168 [Arthromyces matolae]|nr:hypothetical protein H0H93_005168 [Arthromyces matolae]